jgi:ABC-type polysaccharide transport system permease subunit
MPAQLPPMVKHIFSVIDLKKMIPVNSCVYTPVYINPTAQDSVDVIKYKILLTKELRFCIKIKDALLKKASKLYQTVILLPFLMSWVVVSYLVFAFLSSENGLVNHSVMPLLGKEPVNWYGDKRYWPFILVLVNT